MEDLLRQRIAADITSQFKGVCNLSVEQIATAIGLNPAHIRNQVSQGIFPVQSVLIGRRRLFPLTHFIDYMTSLMCPSVSNKRGPKTKASKMRARVSEVQA